MIAVKRTMEQRFNLEGKTALVTGAAGLLGIEHACGLLQYGATVLLTDISTQKLIETKAKLLKLFPKAKLSTYAMDVSNPKSVNSILKILQKKKVNVNILLNNAAINPKYSVLSDNNFSRLENFSLPDWDFQLSVGLTGAFVCTQVFGTEMAKNGDGGVILNIASDLSIIAPDQRLYEQDGLQSEDQPVKPITYSVIKSGLIGLTRYVAAYWAQKGVRCNALSPGGVFDGQSEEFLLRIKPLIPMGRLADHSEYREAIVFLCSDASSYLTGQNIVMDGGRSII